jgi:hypothetical protein
MNKFERFIIYPMLFIALFFSFADDGVKQTTAQQVYDKIIADEIVANKIKLFDSNGETTMFLTGEPGGVAIYSDEHMTTFLGNTDIGVGVLNLYGDEKINGVSIAAPKESSGIIKIKNNYNNLVLELGSAASNKKGQGEGDGLINIYDKYGEDKKSYSYK